MKPIILATNVKIIEHKLTLKSCKVAGIHILFETTSHSQGQTETLLVGIKTKKKTALKAIKCFSLLLFQLLNVQLSLTFNHHMKFISFVIYELH